MLFLVFWCLGRGQKQIELTVELRGLHVSSWRKLREGLGPNRLLRKGLEPLFKRFQCFAFLLSYLCRKSAFSLVLMLEESRTRTRGSKPLRLFARGG